MDSVLSKVVELTKRVIAAADKVSFLAWLRLLCLDGELARAEPKTLRHRLLHAAARIVRRARRTILRLPAHWPWADELATAELARSASSSPDDIGPPETAAQSGPARSPGEIPIAIPSGAPTVVLPAAMR